MMFEYADMLRAGGVVGMPTETVYGLAADARSESAVRRVFELKGRPSTNPLIVHVATVQVAERYAVLNGAARQLFERFSPGPLTIVLPKRDPNHRSPAAGDEDSPVCDLVTAGLGTVGIRIPDHPVALTLLRAFDGPLAAPSANVSNHVSPTTADHVRAEFGDAVPVLDGGACRVGIESTVLDLSRGTPRILRPGAVTRERIEAVIGPVDVFSGHVSAGLAAASPGQSLTHYAPRSLTWRFERDEQEAAEAYVAAVTSNDRVVLIASQSNFTSTFEAASFILRPLPDSPEQSAHDLYALLRDVDAMRPHAILIEMPPDEARWAAVRDRLSRAARPLREARPRQ